MKSENMGPTYWREQRWGPSRFEKPYGRIWISTQTLVVYPPMSPGVIALTFLRSTSQGVEARQAYIRGQCPNVENSSRPIRASLVKERIVNKAKYRSY